MRCDSEVLERSSWGGTPRAARNYSARTRVQTCPARACVQCCTRVFSLCRALVWSASLVALRIIMVHSRVCRRLRVFKRPGLAENAVPRLTGPCLCLHGGGFQRVLPADAAGCVPSPTRHLPAHPARLALLHPCACACTCVAAHDRCERPCSRRCRPGRIRDAPTSVAEQSAHAVGEDVVFEPQGSLREAPSHGGNSL